MQLNLYLLSLYKPIWIFLYFKTSECNSFACVCLSGCTAKKVCITLYTLAIMCLVLYAAVRYGTLPRGIIWCAEDRYITLQKALMCCRQESYIEVFCVHKTGVTCCNRGVMCCRQVHKTVTRRKVMKMLEGGVVKAKVETGCKGCRCKTANQTPDTSPVTWAASKEP